MSLVPETDDACFACVPHNSERSLSRIRNLRDVSTASTEYERALSFLESLVHPQVPAALPDGENINFVLKPVRSSYVFELGPGGTATMMLLLPNPLGRVAELWIWDEDAGEYMPPILFNQAQLLSSNYDYARFVKGCASLKSTVLPSGQYALSGIHMMVRFPYPASEKPSSDGSGSPYSKYSYQALVGVQTDLCNMRSSMTMDQAVHAIDFGQMGQPPIRLGDSVVTTTSTSGLPTTVEARDGTKDIRYTVAADNFINNQTLNLTNTSQQFFRTGKILMTSVGGISANIQFSGSAAVGTLAAFQIETTWFLETYDLMGLPIDTFSVVVLIPIDAPENPQLNFARTLCFSLPEPGEALNKPTISQVQVGVALKTVSISAATLNAASASVHGWITAGCAQAWGVGRPSTLWAVDQGKNQQFVLDTIQWFEATPNSNLLQTTTTIPIPLGSAKQKGIFWKGLRELSEHGSFSYVYTDEEWFKMINQEAAHDIELLEWRPKLFSHVHSLASGDTAGPRRFFRGLARKVSKVGRKALSTIGKEAMYIGSKVAPQVLDAAVHRLGSMIGLTPEETDLIENVAKGLVAGKSGALRDISDNFVGKITNQISGDTSGGSLSGGSLSGARRIQYNFRGSTSGKRKGLGYHYQFDDKGGYIRIPMREFEVRVPQSLDTPIVMKGDCSGRMSSRDDDKVLSKQRVVTWGETRGIFVPCVFWSDSTDSRPYVRAGGTYYLYRDPQVFEELATKGKWTKGGAGTFLVGHEDSDGVQPRIAKDVVLMGVTSLKGSGGEMEIKGGFDAPGHGPSVEAALCLQNNLDKYNFVLTCPIAVTGPMTQEKSGEWKFDSVQDPIAYFKAGLFKDLEHPIPSFGNSDFFTRRVASLGELRRCLGFRTVLNRGHTSANTVCDDFTLQLSKRPRLQMGHRMYWSDENLEGELHGDTAPRYPKQTPKQRVVQGGKVGGKSTNFRDGTKVVARSDGGFVMHENDDRNFDFPKKRLDEDAAQISKLLLREFRTLNAAILRQSESVAPQNPTTQVKEKTDFVRHGKFRLKNATKFYGMIGEKLFVYNGACFLSYANSLLKDGATKWNNFIKMWMSAIYVGKYANSPLAKLILEFDAALLGDLSTLPSTICDKGVKPIDFEAAWKELSSKLSAVQNNKDALEIIVMKLKNSKKTEEAVVKTLTVPEQEIGT